MSNLFYKNPISPIQVPTSFTVSREKTFGTNFSVLGVGGYMEVYSLSDLVFTIPVGQTGNIELSTNIIPIHFKKSNGSVFSYDVLTLNSDNISSGRRRLGMLVYVYETKKIYQYTIENYDTLWSAATGATGPGGKTVVISDFGTTVKNNTVAGQNFINSWTASTIEGVNGYTNLDATWRELKTGGGSGTTTGDYLPLSGGTVTGDTIFQSGLTANTISATTYQNLPVDPDTFVTGFTLTNDEIVLTQNRDDSYSSFTISLSAYTGVTSVTASSGLSGNTTTGDITLINTAPDQTVVITGGTNIQIISDYPNFGINFTGTTSSSGDYLPLSGGTVTGDTIFQSGLTANTISATTYFNLPTDLYTTGFTFNTTNYDLTIKRNGGLPDLTQSLSILASDLTITGGTYNSGTGVATFTNNTGGTFTVSGFLTGYTDTVITAFTYNNNTFTIKDSSGSTFNSNFNTVTGLTVNGDLTVTGNTSLQGLTATTISATTYQNLPTDIRTTGGTYSNNTFTFTNNTGGTYSVLFNTVTGLTVNGGLTVTGNTSLRGLTATTISATTYQNLPSQSGTGISAFSYNQSTGLLTITKNDTTTLTAGTFSYVTATTLSSSNVLSVTSNGGSPTTTTINAVTGGTYSNGTITLSGTGSVNGTQITGLSALTPTTLYSGDGTLLSNRIVNLSSYTLNFSSSTNPNTLVMSGGSVGIGVSTPESKLQVSGVTTITGQWNTGSTVNGLHFSFGHPVTGPNIGQIFSIQNGVSWRRLDVEGDPLILNGQSGGNVGIGITSPLTALHVSSVSDPLTLSGVQSTDDAEVLTIDTNGVVHKKPIFLKNRTNSSTETVIAYQSIFNPADLGVRDLATFFIARNATYYVLGDLDNRGSIVVDGTLKVGGIIKNNGSITGSGIIE